MRAAIYRQPGAAADVLRVEEIPTPDPGPGEVRVRVAISGVNPTDWKSRAGATPRPIPSATGFQVPNQDGAGTVDAVGEGVDGRRVGERVWLMFAAAENPWGTAAQYSIVPAQHAVPLPDSASFELGAGLGVPAVTAWQCLTPGPDGLAGTSVLVAGGAGAVGHSAIELAKHAGARVVTTVSSPEKAELARAAGADLVVNYRDDDAVEQVKGFAERVDRVVEVALGANLDLDLAVCGPGTVISTYASEATDPTIPTRRLMAANATLRFVLLYGVLPQQITAAVEGVSAALWDGALSALPPHRFALPDIAAAHDAVESGAVGKVLVVPEAPRTPEMP